MAYAILRKVATEGQPTSVWFDDLSLIYLDGGGTGAPLPQKVAVSPKTASLGSEMPVNAAAGVTVNPATTSTTITRQPVDQAVIEGLDAVFDVVASGSGTLHYQWQRKTGMVWADIPDGILSSYTIRECGALDSGIYFRCVVTGTDASVTSTQAELIVEETPWQRASGYADGTVVSDIFYTNYTMGYHFKPKHNGQIVRLGGFFNGTNMVSLWSADGVLLAEAVVSASSGNWGYTKLSSPVSVTEGERYTVAATLDNGGGSYRSVTDLPLTHADILIEGAAYGYSETGARVRPTNLVLNEMYGQADVTYVRSGALANSPPDIIAGNPPDATANAEWQYQVKARDADGDEDDILFALEKAPAGMSIDSKTGLIRWFPDGLQVGQHTVIVHVADSYEEAEPSPLTVIVNP